MLNLSTNVTLVALGSTRITETIKAIKHCQSIARFYNTIYLTDSNIDDPKIKHIKIRNIPSIEDYQKFIVNESAEIILSSVSDSFNGHFLCINWDGFIINPESWTDEFLNYDYIGAPWPWFNHMVGNGGFCLKSKKFLEIQRIVGVSYKVINNEDVELSIRLRSIFEKYGCKYADSKIGYQFATEHGGYNNYHSFGFHDFKYNKQFIELIK